MSGSLLTARQRFAAKLAPADGGCIVFTGSTGGGEYGTFKVDGRMVKAHRWAWEQEHGPIPAGLHVHHVCENKTCVNVSHLRVLTVAEHAEVHDWQARNLRPGGGGVFNKRKMHCPKGHPYDDTNTWIDKTGRRHCRACARERARRKYRSQQG